MWLAESSHCNNSMIAYAVLVEGELKTERTSSLSFLYFFRDGEGRVKMIGIPNGRVKTGIDVLYPAHRGATITQRCVSLRSRDAVNLG